MGAFDNWTFATRQAAAPEASATYQSLDLKPDTSRVTLMFYMEGESISLTGLRAWADALIRRAKDAAEELGHAMEDDLGANGYGATYTEREPYVGASAHNPNWVALRFPIQFKWHGGPVAEALFKQTFIKAIASGGGFDLYR